MQITEITYKTNRARFNNKYEHDHVEIKAVLSEDDDLDEAYDWLREEAERFLVGDRSTVR